MVDFKLQYEVKKLIVGCIQVALMSCKSQLQHMAILCLHMMHTNTSDTNMSYNIYYTYDFSKLSQEYFPLKSCCERLNP